MRMNAFGFDRVRHKGYMRTLVSESIFIPIPKIFPESIVANQSLHILLWSTYKAIGRGHLKLGGAHRTSIAYAVIIGHHVEVNSLCRNVLASSHKPDDLQDLDRAEHHITSPRKVLAQESELSTIWVSRRRIPQHPELPKHTT